MRLTSSGVLDISLDGFGPERTFISGARLPRGYSYPITGATGDKNAAIGFTVLPDNRILVGGYGAITTERWDSMILGYSENGLLEGLDYHNIATEVPVKEYPSNIISSGNTVYIAGRNLFTDDKFFVKSFLKIP